MIVGADYGLIGKDLRLVENVYISVRNGLIERVYTSKPSHVDVYYEDGVILPGLINAHIHMADGVAREAAYGKSIFEAVVGRDSIKFRILDSTPPDRLVEGFRSVFSELVARGITSVFDFREGGIEGINVLRRAVNGIEGPRVFVLGRPHSGDSLVDIIENSDGLGLSSLNRYRGEDLGYMARLVKEKGKLLFAHVSETREQREKSFSYFGVSDVFRGLKVGLNGFVHLTHATENELELVWESGGLPIFCPRANSYLGVGLPPIVVAVEKCKHFGIGTDNVMLNMPDLFRELDFIVRLSRLEGVTPDPRCLLKSLTVFVGVSLGLKIGVVEEGYYADFFVFDLSRPNVFGVGDIFRAIVLRGSEENVWATYVGGRKVYERE